MSANSTEPAPAPAALPALPALPAPPVVAPVGQATAGAAPRRADGDDRFSVVALGGSAGSLVAFEQFFRHLPPDSGLAFVVIMHLSPTQPSELAAVLQRFTAMPVLEATDGLRVQRNRMYVIPPDRDMSILHGALLLAPPAQPHGRRLPIDHFFQSMAQDLRERAVCVVLSGMGADGAIGLKMVMENFGMVMVQDPATAEYDSMPRAALATEFVDYVLPADELPARLLDYVRKPGLVRPRREAAESPSRPANALQKTFALIRARTGHDFSSYKRNTVFRRIERRMNAHQIREFTHYVRYLQENPAEVDALFKELLIGVTKFFRDKEAFALLQERLLPLLRGKPADGTVRVWAPGCSTGEEAYTLAMCVLECLDQLEPGHYLRVQVFATDINPEGVEMARAGLYVHTIEADVSPARLARFFTQTEGHYQVNKEVRDVVVFAVHNLVKDAPFTRLDLLVCRNLLIYLSTELQKSILPVFHYALNPGGLLLLGPSENLSGFPDLFVPLDVKWKLSRRADGPATLGRMVQFPFALAPPPPNPAPAASSMSSTTTPKDGSFATLVQRLLLGQYTPPAVVINTKGDILYVNGRTGRYLEPAPGLGGMNLFDMAREELRYELSGAVDKALTTRQPTVADGVRLKTEAGIQLLRLRVQPLADPDPLAGLLLVVFEDQPTPRRVRLGKAAPADGRDGAAMALERELQFTKHRLQTTIEEMESSLEELKSTNEELQSTNEELQSTNEEAMTNKEEMQSLNEELMTLNMQYLSKTEEVSLAANDMKNLLDATEIATIFLDNDMVVKRFTPPVQRIVALLPADVGRPITHFANTLRYENLAQDVRQVLDRLVSVETNIQTTAGEWYAMRILPYRTLDNYISGAVITFTDITALKALETQLQTSRRLAEAIVETVRGPLLILDAQRRVVAISHAFSERFGLNASAVKGQSINELDGGVWQLPALRQRLDALLADPSVPFDDFRFTADFAGAGPRHLLAYGRALTSDGQFTGCLLLGMEEVADGEAAARPPKT